LKTKSPLNVAVVCGGQSAEHEISILSSKYIIRSLEQAKYRVKVIFINKQGEWYIISNKDEYLNCDDINGLINQPDQAQRINLSLGKNNGFNVLHNNTLLDIDVIFPILHGTHGEDGTVQGMFELVNIPYVGSGVLGSSVCMDKDISKLLFKSANIPTANWLTFNQSNISKATFENVKQQLGSPVFVKPANTGSSIGISKVSNSKTFKQALDNALQYDHKLLVEEFIDGREIECSVLGNGSPQVSLPGEIVVHRDFYDYEAKYLDPNGASLHIPAELPAETVKKIQQLALHAFTTLGCQGLARVDFLLSTKGDIFVNEINTLPGFTEISMYPKLWEASGIPGHELMDKLVKLAVDRHQQEGVLINTH